MTSCVAHPGPPSLVTLCCRTSRHAFSGQNTQLPPLGLSVGGRTGSLTQGRSRGHNPRVSQGWASSEAQLCFQAHLVGDRTRILTGQG